MNNHLADARKYVDSASQAVYVGSAVAWLLDACKQIIAHLEAQQASNTLNDKCPACRDDQPPMLKVEVRVYEERSHNV